MYEDLWQKFLFSQGTSSLATFSVLKTKVTKRSRTEKKKSDIKKGIQGFQSLRTYLLIKWWGGLPLLVPMGQECQILQCRGQSHIVIVPLLRHTQWRYSIKSHFQQNNFLIHFIYTNSDTEAKPNKYIKEGKKDEKRKIMSSITYLSICPREWIGTNKGFS